jgi:hypothetical protein
MAYSAQGWPTIPVIPVIKISMVTDGIAEDYDEDTSAYVNFGGSDA